jgi:hypothetical protein
MAETQDPSDSGQMDADAAMREMMGFSSFNTRPKNRSGESFLSFEMSPSLNPVLRLNVIRGEEGQYHHIIRSHI